MPDENEKYEPTKESTDNFEKHHNKSFISLKIYIKNISSVVSTY